MFSVANPLFVDIGEESTVPAFDVRLDNAIVSGLIADIFDLLASSWCPVLEKIWLKL